MTQSFVWWPRASCWRVLLVWVALSLIGTPSPARDLQGEESIADAWLVIVHPDVEGASVTRELLADIFLKKATRWGKGRAIAPIDQSLRSPVRERFSREILGKTPDEVLRYWRTQISSGKRPPRSKDTDTEVIEFVSAHEGAIGYVSVQAPLAEAAVKTLTVTD